LIGAEAIGAFMLLRHHARDQADAAGGGTPPAPAPAAVAAAPAATSADIGTALIVAGIDAIQNRLELQARLAQQAKDILSWDNAVWGDRERYGALAKQFTDAEIVGLVQLEHPAPLARMKVKPEYNHTLGAGGAADFYMPTPAFDALMPLQGIRGGRHNTWFVKYLAEKRGA
jgi:hypothetical protein